VVVVVEDCWGERINKLECAGPRRIGSTRRLAAEDAAAAAEGAPVVDVALLDVGRAPPGSRPKENPAAANARATELRALPSAAGFCPVSELKASGTPDRARNRAIKSSLAVS